MLMILSGWEELWCNFTLFWCIIRGTLTLELEEPTPLKFIISVVENAETRYISLYTRAWGLKELRKIEWMQNLHGVLHGMQWIIFFTVDQFFCEDHLKEVGLTQNQEIMGNQNLQPFIY